MTNYIRKVDGKEYAEFGFWLVFTNDATSPRVYAREPRLKASERSMFMSVMLPVSLWEVPTLKASVSVPDSSVKPITVDTTAAASALKYVLGFDVEVKIAQPEVE